MEPGTIAVSGGSGLVGSSLLPALDHRRILRLVRSSARGPGEVRWDPGRGTIDAAGLEGCDAVVHLAGEPIAARRWSAPVKQRILRSRVDATRLLVSTLVSLPSPPRVLVSASAIGIYGDRGEEDLDESSPRGTGFLADVADAWEAEALRAASAGIRVVCLRFGIILASHGGALAKMLPPFRLGAGGRLGAGRQWMSWIHIHDVVEIIRRALTDPELGGPVNVVSPEPVRNADFARALGRSLGRPAVIPAPAFALRLALGEMAQALLLSSQKVAPARLRSSGHAFRFPGLDEALRDLLG
jgi:uncharacterized protein (TIGR01777 family)